MVAERLHSPKQIIQGEGHPTYRLVVTHVECTEHPANLRPAQTTIKRILYDGSVVVPVDKSILQNRQERRQAQEKDKSRQKTDCQRRRGAVVRFGNRRRLFSNSF